ncbi:MAG: magnesium transporter [Bacteroidetes bacterium]|nr:MAG: magnesium transporter [Bacteroidota bacterium]
MITPKESLLRLRELIEAEQTTELLAFIESELYAADIAELAYDLQLEEVKFIMDAVEPNLAVDILKDMDTGVREKLLGLYDSEIIAHRYVDLMDSDDAVDLLNQLSLEVRDQVISMMTDQVSSRNIVSLLHYKEDVAGGLMAKEYIKVNINWTVSQCTDEIRLQAETVEKVYTTYVVDDLERLVGIVSLKSIILANARTKVEKIYTEDAISVNTHTPAEEVAQMMRKYDLIVLPVVDALGRLIGRITIDDVVDFMKEEADKDYQLLSGLAEDVEITDRVWILSRARLPWLLIGLLGGIASSRVIGLYEGELSAFPQMAFFMPLVAAMGGNAGVQSSAIVVQGLANNTLGSNNILPKLGKEFTVALLNGLICSVLILFYNLIVTQSEGLAYTVSIALLAAIVFASLLGMIVPLLLDKVKIDPALATGPFITTTNDLLGLGLYFGIGAMLLG